MVILTLTQQITTMTVIQNKGELYILDSNNKIVDTIPLNLKKDKIIWKPKSKSSSTYFFRLVCNNKIITSEKALLIK